MPNRTTTFRFLLLAVIAVAAYLAVTLPPKVLEQYNAAMEQSQLVGYGYLAVVSLGGLVLAGLAAWTMWKLWINTRTRQQSERRRSTDPNKLSAADRRAELDDNIEAGRDYAATGGIGDAVRAEIERAVAEMEAKREAERLEIVAFGAISSGKSSLLNALAGRDVFRTGVVGGTTTAQSNIEWPGSDRVVLVDTPGLAEVAGSERGQQAAEAAKNADLVLMVIDGPIRDYEHELLEALASMGKRVVVCLNKADWYTDSERAELCAQIAEQVRGLVAADDVVSVRSRSVERPIVRMLADGTQQPDTVTEPPDIVPLANRLLQIVKKEGETLLLANLLMQSRGLVDDAKERVLAALDEQASRVVDRYMWAAAGVTGANPVPLLDIAGGTAVTAKMVIDLAAIYKQKIDSETIIELLGQLTKNLLAILGVSAITAAPAFTSAVATVLKTIPGVGTIAGGLLQGLVQALVTRWIGRVFMQYFRNEMKPPEGGIAELARRQWSEVTSPEQLRKLITMGRQKLDD
ncbi:YcjF family protein [Aeoliella mucimassa]|uniref:tRNA modification GTPase TrmE n=1 Tax=Aeoliella mucimassa TaxID=2527972 RepID=A0A518AHR3_9BACT|nr:GTP-binding protein [Aeoliella mucimassa]QDU54266.1 tRNA modification GTPase TrmE [Aeoliella mucimassa]